MSLAIKCERQYKITKAINRFKCYEQYAPRVVSHIFWIITWNLPTNKQTNKQKQNKGIEKGGWEQEKNPVRIMINQYFTALLVLNNYRKNVLKSVQSSNLCISAHKHKSYRLA